MSTPPQITREALRRDGTLPLVVALRAPDQAGALQEDELVQRFSDALTRLKRSFPGTPVRVRSLLADRLDARVALAASALSDVVVEALLPDGVEIAARLGELGLAGANALEATPVRLRAGRVGGAGEAEWRRAAGNTLVRHAIVLVAAWQDDADPNVAGSTAELVRHMTVGPPIAEDPRGAPRVGPADLGPVLRVALGEERLAWWEPGSDPFQAGERPRPAAGAFGLGQALRLPADLAPLRRYNRRVARYLAADATSIGGKRRVNGLRAALIVLALLASFGLSFYARVPENPALLSLFLGGIAAGTLLVRTARWRHLEEGYLDARMLAEGLRVLRAWNAASIADDPVYAYPMEHALDTTWIRQGLRSTWVALETERAGEAQRAAGLAWAHEHWVTGQRTFYENQLARDRDYAKAWGLALNVARLALFSGLVGLAAVHGLDGFAKARSWLIFAIVGSFTTLGMLRNVRDGLSFDLQVKQYGWCRRLFEQEAATRPDTENLAAVSRRYGRLGRSALEEQSAWLLYHRLRPIRRA